MLIGLIADTHDHLPHIERAVYLFKQRKADLVLHAGDYCSPFTIPRFEGLSLKGIFGNNDGDKYLLMEKFRLIGAELAGDFLALEAGGRSFAIYHGTHQEITYSLCRSGMYDVVVSGHTHRAGTRKEGKTLAINPGTANGFGEKATIAFLDTDTLEVDFEELN